MVTAVVGRRGGGEEEGIGEEGRGGRGEVGGEVCTTTTAEEEGVEGDTTCEMDPCPPGVEVEVGWALVKFCGGH